MAIRLLSDQMINRIAAGEVVERPSSVLKELLENALDAGSSRITVWIEDAGKSLIAVEDDGSGIEPQDFPLIFQRHATSKLNEDNLLLIKTMGFRGEALAAIASVSQVVLRTRILSEDFATELTVTQGKIQEDRKVNGPKGTKIEVRNLFQHVPARLNFLASDRTEKNALMAVLCNTALAHPEVEFHFFEDGTESKRFRSCHDVEGRSALSQRVRDVMGASFMNNAVFIDGGYEKISVTGFIALPTLNTSTGNRQFFFVNRRCVKDKQLLAALRLGYRDLLAKDRYAPAVILIQLPEDEVDVNVHPAKTEVRFRFSRSVFQAVSMTVGDALRASSSRTSSTLADNLVKKAQSGTLAFLKEHTEEDVSPQVAQSLFYHAPESACLAEGAGVATGSLRPGTMAASVPRDVRMGQTLNSSSSVVGGVNRSVPRDIRRAHTEELNRSSARVVGGMSRSVPHDIRRAHTEELDRSSARVVGGMSRSVPHDIRRAHTEELDRSSTVEVSECIEKPLQSNWMPTDENRFLGEAFYIFGERYILSKSQDSLWLIDYHAAHERLIYEEMKQNLISSTKLTSQVLGFPEVVNLDHSALETLLLHKEDLVRLGLKVKILDSAGVSVHAVPEVLKNENVASLLRDWVEELQEMGSSFSLEEKFLSFLSTRACRAAVKSGCVMNHEVMNILLRRMEKLGVSGQCNHGRPAFIRLTLKDLDQLFQRH